MPLIGSEPVAAELTICLPADATKADAELTKADQSAWFAHRFGAAGNDDASRLLEHGPYRLHLSHDQVLSHSVDSASCFSLASPQDLVEQESETPPPCV